MNSNIRIILEKIGRAQQLAEAHGECVRLIMKDRCSFSESEIRWITGSAELAYQQAEKVMEIKNEYWATKADWTHPKQKARA